MAEGAPAKAGVLSSFVRNIGVNVMGTQSLALEDIQPALEQLKKKLMERNVAEEIAAKYAQSLLQSLLPEHSNFLFKVLWLVHILQPYSICCMCKHSLSL